MSEFNLSKEQLARKKEIESVGSLIGFICALLSVFVIWFLMRSGFPYLKYVAVLVAAPIVFIVCNSLYIHVKSSDAKCAKCGADFSVVHSGRDEVFLSATPRRRESEVGRAISGPNEGRRSFQIDTWTEEKYQIIDSFVCESCGDSFKTKSFKSVESGRTSDRIYRR